MVDWRALNARDILHFWVKIASFPRNGKFVSVAPNFLTEYITTAIQILVIYLLSFSLLLCG
jgi:hypothetical protein